jgi:hypothetical protein
MRCCSSLSGAMPRASANHTSSSHRQDHELRQDHALDDLGGQPGALALRLGHLHQRDRRATGLGGRPQHRHPTGSLNTSASRHLPTGRGSPTGTGISPSPASRRPCASITWK